MDKADATFPNDAQVGLEDATQFIEALTQTAGVEAIGEGEVEARLVEPAAGPSGAARGAHTPSWVGKTLGHFKLLRLLGQGAMGIVIQAEDVNLQRIVALKVLRKRIAGVGAEKAVEQFLREARAAASLEHPNVVRVYEINQHQGWWYIAYEMIEGGNLKAVVKTVGPLAPNRACPIIADAATALAVAHQAGIIHRDVKPSNLMLTRTGRCKLMDFGLVRITDPNDPFDFTDKSVGTPQYMAPEIIRKEPMTSAVDVYSLGTTLYFALVGEPPFTGKTQREILLQHLEASPPDVRLHAPRCTQTLASLLERMLAKNPKARPNAAEVAVALRTEAVNAIQDAGETNMSTGSFFAMATVGASTANADAEFGGPITDAGPLAESRSEVDAWAGWPWLFAAAAIAAVLAIGAFALLSLKPAGTFVPVQKLGEGFATGIETYGDRPAGDLPLAQPLDPPPPFSWRGRIDPGDARFVAARDGRRYFAIEDARADLIPADQFVGYATAMRAIDDGKQPAP